MSRSSSGKGKAAFLYTGPSLQLPNEIKSKSPRIGLWIVCIIVDLKTLNVDKIDWSELQGSVIYADELPPAISYRYNRPKQKCRGMYNDKEKR